MILLDHAFLVTTIYPDIKLLFLLIQTPGLINEHYRNIITNRIQQSALFTNQSITRLRKLNRPLALRTGQNVQQIFIDHFSLRSHTGNHFAFITLLQT